jgi:hypothetical protein
MISVGQPRSRLWRRMVLPAAGVLALALAASGSGGSSTPGAWKHTVQRRNRGHGRAAVLAPELQWTIQQTHERTSRVAWSRSQTNVGAGDRAPGRLGFVAGSSHRDCRG